MNFYFQLANLAAGEFKLEGKKHNYMRKCVLVCDPVVYNDLHCNVIVVKGADQPIWMNKLIAAYFLGQQNYVRE